MVAMAASTICARRAASVNVRPAAGGFPGAVFVAAACIS